MGMFSKVGRVIAEPARFFEHLRWEEQGIKSAFLYILAFGFFFALLRLSIGLMFHALPDTAFATVAAKMAGFSASYSSYYTLALVFLVLGGYVLSIPISFVYVALLHVWILIFGGKGRYAQSYQLYAYASIPSMIFGWIPYLLPFAIIYNVILMIVGTHHLHQLSKLRSALIFIIPLLLIGVIFGIFMLKSDLPQVPSSLQEGNSENDQGIRYQQYLFLTDRTTNITSDQVLFTLYKNGTATCGYAVLDDGCGDSVDAQAQQCHEDACYKMVEEAFSAQLAALKAQGQDSGAVQ